MWPPFSSDPDMDKYRKVLRPKAMLSLRSGAEFHPPKNGGPNGPDLLNEVAETMVLSATALGETVVVACDLARPHFWTSPQTFSELTS
eukprot:s1491_g12.t1